MTNQQIARQLQQYAREIQARRESLYRVRAYRRAALEVQRFDTAIADVAVDDLGRTPGIGKHLAVVISNYARTGEWRTYDQLAA